MFAQDIFPALPRNVIYCNIYKKNYISSVDEESFTGEL